VQYPRDSGLQMKEWEAGNSAEFGAENSTKNWKEGKRHFPTFPHRHLLLQLEQKDQARGRMTAFRGSECGLGAATMMNLFYQAQIWCLLLPMKIYTIASWRTRFQEREMNMAKTCCLTTCM
jgi:hypothetical protein